MSTPRKPGEQGDGTTRAVPAESAPEANEPKASGAPETGEPGAAAAPPQRPAQTPPWQRGQQQRSAQQSTAQQSTAPKPSARPVVTGTAAPKAPGKGSVGKPAAKPVVTGTAAPKPVVTGTAAPKPVVTGTAAPKPPAGRAKAAALDGPTRSIARPDLAKDMPDLSEVKHPTPTAAPTPAGWIRKAAVSSAVSAALVAPAPAEGEGLRATVQVRRVDPWSALKVSLVISVALFFVWMVAVGLLYVVLDGMGVWDRLNSTFSEMVSDSSGAGLVTSGQVFGYSALVGLMNVVLFTAIATIGSFIYNLCSDLVGGVQVTLADPD
ncbi:DUF3566 domain-containing protein [Prescottella subtropica]|uniref:DUF3566 domain-containing protein n=1 Tax=Prescottella subtropica TaxID=2545757 RepID=UPI001F503E92|nr:DUF3566 domain-containing protein [Prescottella subtropica]